MAYYVAGAIIASTIYSTAKQKEAQKKAQKQAEEDAIEAEMQARKAETFAGTEGEGIGSLGKISLEVDEDLDEDEELSSNVRV